MGEGYAMQPHMRVVALALAFVLWGMGCTVLSPYRYNVRWENRSGTPLEDVRISYGGFSTTFGGHLYVTEPLPESVTVQFRAPGGRLDVKQVPISEYIRRSIRLADLYFIITPELGVRVELKTKEQIEAERRELYRRKGWAWPP